MTAPGAQRVLLLHPEDDPARFVAHSHYDLVVDLARAPASTCESWSRMAGCRVMSIHELGAGNDDLHRTRELLQLGMGEVVDRHNIDWWDVLAQTVVPSIQQLLLVRRLAEMVGPSPNLYATRPHFAAAALQKLRGGTLTELQTGKSLFGRTKHYVNAVQQLDLRQFLQVLQDKFDPEHNLRRRFARRKSHSSRPLVLLPSAYVNVSRTAVAYAATVPDINFLLVTGRNSARLTALPPNVQMESLDGYFSDVDHGEIKSLLERWSGLELKLRQAAPEFAIAEDAGVLENAHRLRWGIAIRNAWLSLYESQNISACICADDTNPYSRIPLVLAHTRGLPTVACHHGALDNRMAIKRQHSDLYLAKGEMEKDYLVRVCQVSPERIVMCPPASAASQPLKRDAKEIRHSLVFFTEPYHVAGWRMNEVYRDLLPRLLSVARECGLQLVFKLHPFESVKGQWRILNRLISPSDAREIRVVAGPISAEFWPQVSCALTVQSTVALDCAERSIPVFLCGWLADSCSGYAQQYARFGLGHLLDAPQDLARIPEWLKHAQGIQLSTTEPVVDAETLRKILTGSYSRAARLTA